MDRGSQRVIYWGWFVFCLLAFIFWPAGPKEALASFVVFFFVWLLGLIGWWLKFRFFS